MNTTRRIATFVTTVTLLAGAFAARAGAQGTQDQSLGSSRFSVEPYLSHMFYDNPLGDNEGIGGVGVRVMLGRGDVTRTLDSFFSRARAGAFLTFTSDQTDFDIKTLHFGGQVEAPVFAAPVANGYLDPFISLAAGGLRSSVDLEGPGDRSFTDFTFTPGVGTLIPLFGAIAFRGDIRDVIIFGDNTTNNFTVEGGVSIGF